MGRLRAGYLGAVVFLVVLFPVLVMAFALVLERFEVIALTPRRAPRTDLATVTPFAGPTGVDVPSAVDAPSAPLAAEAPRAA